MEDRTEYSLEQDISFTYNVLGGIANCSPFRPDADEKGFYFLFERVRSGSLIC